VGGTCSNIVEIIHKVLVVKLEGKRTLARHSRIWEDNIKIKLMLEESDYIQLAQDRLQWLTSLNTVIKFSGSTMADIF
jgi:hypothetical protein